MSFNIVRGHFAPPAAVQIKELAKDVKGIAKEFKTTPAVLHYTAMQSGNAPDFFYQCIKTITEKNVDYLPAALKQYFLPQWVEDQEHRLTQEQKNQINAQMLALKLNASLSDEDLKKIKLKNWIEFNRSIGNIGSLKEFIKCNKTNKAYWKELLANLKNLFGVNKLKVKEDYDIKTYFDSDNFKKTETDETKPEYIIGDSEKIIKEQKEAFNSLQLPIELINSKEELRTTFETLFEKGRKSKDYSFYSVPLNQTIFNTTIQNIKDKMGKIGLNSAYKKAVMEYQQSQFKNWGIDKEMVTDEQGNEIGSLITIPQTKEDETNFENRYQVIQTHSCESWCIHQANAESYIEKGKMIIYMPKNSKENVGFSYKGNQITEIETSENDLINPANIERIDVILNTPLAKNKVEPDLSETIKYQLYTTRNTKEAWEHILSDFNFAPNAEKYSYAYIIDNQPYILDSNSIKPKEIKDLNKAFKNNDNDNITNNLNNFNIKYLNKLKERVGNAEYVFNYLFPDDLVIINQTFNNNDNVRNDLDQLNRTYFNNFQTKIINAANVLESLPIEHLSVLNRLFGNSNDEVLKNHLKQLNITYLNTLQIHTRNAQNARSYLSTNNLSDLNKLFENNTDEEVKDNLKQLNITYLSALRTQTINSEYAWSNLPINNLSDLNKLFENNADEEIKDNLNQLNSTYLDTLYGQLRNKDQIHCTLQDNMMEVLNKIFGDNPEYEDRLNEIGQIFIRIKEEEERSWNEIAMSLSL